MRRIYANNKPFKIQLHTNMNCRMGLTHIIRETWSGILTVPKEMKVLVLECMNGTQKRP